MKVTYDRSADAAYIYIAPAIPDGGVKRTYACDPRQVGAQINLDFDDEGRILGLEVLDASKHLPAAVLKEATRIG